MLYSFLIICCFLLTELIAQISQDYIQVYQDLNTKKHNYQSVVHLNMSYTVRKRKGKTESFLVLSQSCISFTHCNSKKMRQKIT